MRKDQALFLAAGVVLGLIVGVGVHWYLTVGRDPARLQEIKNKIVTNAAYVAEGVRTQAGEITGEAVQEAIARSGVFIVDKAKQAGDALTHNPADDRIAAAVKARLARDPALSTLAIQVQAARGVVTLSGLVHSHQQIARAVSLALETEGITKVVSTLQIKPAK